jgi:hypothetical protein
MEIKQIIHYSTVWNSSTILVKDCIMVQFKFSLEDELATLLIDQLQIAKMRYTEQRNRPVDTVDSEWCEMRIRQITELLEKIKPV